jgi:hypothetical protein
MKSISLLSKTFVATLFGVSMLLTPSFVSAHGTDRSYLYESIVQDYSVHEDSTVDVVESQTYTFIGEYHVGWRSIALKGVGSIDRISVSDGTTGESLIYSSDRLDKLDPKSWGKYTYFRENGHMNIEWYYNLDDTTHTFVLSYRLHGALGFYRDHDELYWNLATEYSVPIKHISATVHVPDGVGESLHGFFYLNTAPGVPIAAQDQRTISYSSESIAPYEAVTIAAGWQKGVVSVSAYYKELLLSIWGWLLGLVAIIIASVWVYYVQVISVKRLGRGTIIPQY